MHQEFSLKLFILDVLLECFRLFENPSFIGIVSAWSNEDSTRFKMQKRDGEKNCTGVSSWDG